jgi:hypothetical protein
MFEMEITHNLDKAKTDIADRTQTAATRAIKSESNRLRGAMQSEAQLRSLPEAVGPIAGRWGSEFQTGIEKRGTAMTLTEADKTLLFQLSDEQAKAVPLVLLGKTDAEIAKEVGVARGTVNKWQNHSPGFAAAVNQGRQAIWDAALNRLNGLTETCIATVERAITEGNSRLAFDLLRWLRDAHEKDRRSTEPFEIARGHVIKDVLRTLTSCLFEEEGVNNADGNSEKRR